MSFDKLFEKRKQDIQTSKHSDIQRSKPESDPDLDSQTSKKEDSHSSHQQEEVTTQSNIQPSKHSNTQTSKGNESDSSEREEQATTQQNIQTSEHSNVKASKAKSKDDKYIRTTLYLPRKAHQRLKMASISQQEDMSEIVTRLIEDWIEHSDI